MAIAYAVVFAPKGATEMAAIINQRARHGWHPVSIHNESSGNYVAFIAKDDDDLTEVEPPNDE
jgi:hypothetical protein